MCMSARGGGPPSPRGGGGGRMRGMGVDKTPSGLAKTTPVAHPYHTHITAVSHPYHTRVTPVSQPYSHTYHTRITPVSHPYHTRITSVSHPYHTRITPVSHPHHTRSKPIARPHGTRIAIARHQSLDLGCTGVGWWAVAFRLGPICPQRAARGHVRREVERGQTRTQKSTATTENRLGPAAFLSIFCRLLGAVGGPEDSRAPQGLGGEPKRAKRTPQNRHKIDRNSAGTTPSFLSLFCRFWMVVWCTV